ncbi:hypothetical protein HYC85_032045 [Camellia sinensis]|uniref:Uncharacterized protein n=1 Tax=Camellia sinensis TaxID=4442 RepID=A0A7J7FS90_CAMSI|nr:hypothetical protein HYC85_032045 [Camellia sinensis]
MEKVKSSLLVQKLGRRVNLDIKYMIQDSCDAKVHKIMAQLQVRTIMKIRTLIAVGKGHLARNIALTQPQKIGMAGWKAFVKNRLSKSYIQKSEKFKKMREKQKVLHMMSRKGYARLEEDMKNQNQDPNSISRVDVWIKWHTRQKEKPVNEVLQDAMNNFQEIHKPL